MAFGNQTISRVKLQLEGSTKEIHGFASLLRNRFAFIVQSSASKEQCRQLGELKLPERKPHCQQELQLVERKSWGEVWPE